MTPKGRTIIAAVAIVCAVALLMVGAFAQHGEATTAAGASTLALVLGYVFGDRNGEKRLAAALTVAQADTNVASQTAAAIAAPRGAEPTPAEAPTAKQAKATKARKAAK